MIIGGLQKTTLLDFPNHVACIIFTKGCNFRCPFCHNSGLLDMNNNCEKIDEKEVFKYLEKRKGLLDGVCISGGEPLLQKDIEYFIRKVKDLGYKVKLDTNGSSPKKLKQLIEEGLIDYVAMDIKNDFLNYDKTAGMCTNIDNIKKSIEIIENSNIEYEFRTTIVKQFHDVGKLEKIIQYIGPNARYYIQNYQDCSSVLQRGLDGFDEEELLNIKNTLGVKYPNLVVRGV